ncbi:hypothetical protein [Streptomyces sp. NPDC058475]|uniref:hypothetical protein n=1 Tax=unclassified Streptomyces TaxID=2593676 RepID=UPI00365BFDD0
MSARRVALMATASAVAVLGVVLTVVRWDDANKMAVVVSALAAVAAVGISVWAALPGGSSRGQGWQASRTGRAVASQQGQANTGISTPATSAPTVVEVNNTGDAEATGGDANSGVRIT